MIKKKKDRFPRSPWLESKLSRGPIYSLSLPKGPNIFFYPSNTLIFCFPLTHTKLVPTLLSKSNRVQNTLRTHNTHRRERKIEDETLENEIKPWCTNSSPELKSPSKSCEDTGEIENPAAILKKNACESESS